MENDTIETIMPELLEGVKTRLLITGTYHDDMLEALIHDTIDYMTAGGVNIALILTTESKAIGCIARGVADLYNFGAGDGHFSNIFKERLLQLAYTPMPLNEVI